MPSLKAKNKTNTEVKIGQTVNLISDPEMRMKAIKGHVTILLPESQLGSH